MWNTTHFPAAMRSLTPSTRAIAIEIANDLLEQGIMNKPALITQSVAEARRWARCVATSGSSASMGTFGIQ